ncbi:MAG: helix-turn-helix domain-containing protein [Actinomycetota bacterium]|nr:helix-turn-helix domain-containing protein [Actinomycetota bacterium]
MDPPAGPSSVPLLLSVREAARALGIGRSKIYELIKNGEVEVVHIGRSCRVPVAALHDYVDRLRLSREPFGAGRPRPRLRDAAAPQ